MEFINGKEKALTKKQWRPHLTGGPAGMEAGELLVFNSVQAPQYS
jgi:hypothetical protein